MRTKTVFALALAAATLVACETDAGEDATVEPGQELPQAAPPAPMPDQMLISASEFQAMGDAAAGATPIRGTAQLRRSTDEGALVLEVRVEGLPEGRHAWHIHGAPCGEQAGVVVPLSGRGGDAGIHGDLEVGADGVVEQTVTIAPEHLQNLQLESQRALNIHQGPGDNPGPTIACANVGGSTNAAGATGTAPTTGS